MTISELERELVEIDKRRAVLEATMEGLGSSLSMEAEYQHLGELRRTTVALIAAAQTTERIAS